VPDNIYRFFQYENNLINTNLRQLVIQRANHLCEYCLIHDEHTYWGCHIDHIISEKHDGATDADNLGILGFNHIDRLLERQDLQEFGCYPTEEAQFLIDETAW